MTKFFHLFCLMSLFATTTMAQDQYDADTISSQGRSQVMSAVANIANDVNNDGMVDAFDVVDIVKYVNGSKRSEFKVEKADINKDGVVNIEDATYLSKIIIGEIPAGEENPQDPPVNNDDVLRGDSVVDPVGPNK